MALSEEFEAFAVDLFSALGPIRIKRMFGAAMAYRQELSFAILDDEAIWIKVDDAVEPLFVERRCPRFRYSMKDGRVMEMDYRQLPQAALDDPEEACRWAQLGLDVALRKGAKSARSRKGRR